MNRKVSRPTPAQMAVLCRLSAGWELGVYEGVDASARMQEGGLGRGGRAMDVHFGTFEALRRRGWIKRGTYNFPVTHCKLTEAGAAAMRSALEFRRARSIISCTRTERMRK